MTLLSEEHAIPEDTIPPVVVVTESAAKKIWELMVEEGNYDLKLRIYITGGGCSGFQYGFAFEEEIKSDDTVVEKAVADDEGGKSGGSGQITILIDPMSFQYLSGAEIDYISDLDGERFLIRNPNAQTTCGCGSSFSA